MADDRALIQEILDGNTGAFESLINEYKALVIHIVHRMVLDNADREDICQDVFMKVYQNLAGFRFDAKLSTWISKIAYNTCLNHLQKKREALLDECLPETETPDELPASDARPDQLAEEADLWQRLQAEIVRLPVQFRTIVTLYHLEDMSYSEIADVMNLPQGTVKSYLFRARKLLRDRLTAKYRQEDLKP